MSLRDCERCWDFPCTCGWDYRNDSVENLKESIELLTKVLDFKLQNPGADERAYKKHFGFKDYPPPKPQGRYSNSPALNKRIEEEMIRCTGAADLPEALRRAGIQK